MPSGRTHDRITLWSLPAVVVLSLLRTRSGGLTLAIAAGFLFGALMLGPDLDTRSIHYKRWGVFRWIWIPYRGSMKHRSPLSHWPIVGTVVRVTYVLVWALLLVLGSLSLVNEAFQLGWTWDEMGHMVSQSLTTHRSLVWMLVVGLELGALSHYLADWGVSTYKRVRKRYPQEGIRALRLIWQPSQSRRQRSKRRGVLRTGKPAPPTRSNRSSK
ncbi:MAG: metal-binding protein [Synechococcales bacterium]|nr:metal-binding protein [Synechococcales bacterium]